MARKRLKKAKESSEEDEDEELFGDDSDAEKIDDEDDAEADEDAQLTGASESDDYGSDLMGDESDRAKLAAMPELERQQVIYDRDQKRRQRRERKEAAAKLRAKEAEKKEARGKRQQQGGNKDKEKKKSALEDLVAARKEKEKAAAQADGEDSETDEDEVAISRKKRAAKRAREYEESDQDEAGVGAEDRDDTDGEDEETGEKKKRGPTTRTPLRQKDVARLQIRRAALESIYEEPFFDEYVKGKYVRVTLGEGSTGTMKYNMAEIISVQQWPQPYKFGTASKMQKTKKALLLQYGKHAKIFMMTRISNHTITDTEFEQWKAQMAKDQMPVMTAEEALRRKKAADTLKSSFVYTPEMVTALVEQKKKTKGWKNANVSKEMSNLKHAKERAEEGVDGKVDHELVASLQRQIDDLESFLDADRVKQRSQGGSTHAKFTQAVISLNATAKKRNYDMRRAADLGGKERDESFMKRGYVNPFAKTSTAPKPVWTPLNVEEAQQKEAKKKKEEEEQKKKAKEAEASALKAKKKAARVVELRGHSATLETNADQVNEGDLADVQVDNTARWGFSFKTVTESDKILAEMRKAFDLNVEFDLSNKTKSAHKRYVVTNYPAPPDTKLISVKDYYEQRASDEQRASAKDAP